MSEVTEDLFERAFLLEIAKAVASLGAMRKVASGAALGAQTRGALTLMVDRAEASAVARLRENLEEVKQRRKFGEDVGRMFLTDDDRDIETGTDIDRKGVRWVSEICDTAEDFREALDILPEPEEDDNAEAVKTLPDKAFIDKFKATAAEVAATALDFEAKEEAARG